MTAPKFKRVAIGELLNEVGPGPMNTMFNIGDLNSDGLIDIFATGRDGKMAWFQNPGSAGVWNRRLIADISMLECGGLAYDLTGSGYPDVIDGGDWRSDELAWWENPGPESRESWIKHVITNTGSGQFHDEAIGDVTGDGTISLVFWNEHAATLYVTPLPDDPTVSPWPSIHAIATEMKVRNIPEEGLAIADIDGDGRNEIIAGTHWFKYDGKDWEKNRFAADYITTLIAVGDIDGDGKPEIVLSEGDPCIFGYPEGGKLAWFKPLANIRDPWTEHLIDENLLDAHSLQLANMCGNGRLDILVGEIGIKEQLKENPPRLFIYENNGDGAFTRHLIDEGTGTHHARLADFRGLGKLDIASRPLHGPERWQIFVWYNEGNGEG
jgi:hypothetical protein